MVSDGDAESSGEESWSSIGIEPIAAMVHDSYSASLIHLVELFE
jgi:hypothetical protein